jgi:WG containing repeat
LNVKQQQSAKTSRDSQMSNKLISWLATLLTSLSFLSTGLAQTQPTNKTESDLYPIVQNGRVGFIDSKGRVVIRPRFLAASNFSEGLALVTIRNEQNQKYAFIDTSGRIVIRTDASPSAKGFSDGVAVLLSGASHCYIDKKGQMIAGYFGRAEDCTEGLCAIRFDKNILTFNPGWNSDAQPLNDFTDVRELQSQLKARGVQMSAEADESTTAPGSFMIADPDGNTILVDQHI